MSGMRSVATHGMSAGAAAGQAANRTATQTASATSAAADDARLREVCARLEGVFLEQLMKALRETVPESGLTGGGAGEEIFSSLLDAHLADTAAGRLDHGLGAALYRQLRGSGGAA